MLPRLLNIFFTIIPITLFHLFFINWIVVSFGI
jgi:hypothetical protein